MPKVIKDKQVIDDLWSVLGLQDMQSFDGHSTHLIVPLEDYFTCFESKPSGETIYGIWLYGHQFRELNENIKDVLALPIIAIYFSDFTDGRGFSLATLLIERYGYKGELRAFGNILPDQLLYLQRCGFNAFSLEGEEDLEKSCKALTRSSESYQFASDQATPLFKQRCST